MSSSKKRSEVEAYLYKNLDRLDPTGSNTARYKKMFKAMSDKDFDKFMQQLRDHEQVIYLYVANVLQHLNMEDMIQHAKDLGVELFERLYIWDKVTDHKYLTPYKYFIGKLPIRRMMQFIDHKLSVAEGDSKVDMLTGQVMGPDKAAGISQVEIQTLYARNFHSVILELLKYRGGDVHAASDYRRELEETGHTSIGRATPSVARSAVTMDVLLSGMHIESNVAGA